MSDKGNGAYGAYQFVGPTWRGYGFNTLYGVPRADLATDFQQDDAARIALNTLYSDPLCEHDWERVIAAWFAGPQGQAGPKANWNRPPDGTADHNPDIGVYVAGVLDKIKEIR